MAKHKEQRNFLKEQISTVVSPLLDHINKQAAEKTHKRLNKLAGEIAKKFYEELDLIEKKRLKAEEKEKKSQKELKSKKTGGKVEKTVRVLNKKKLIGEKKGNKSVEKPAVKSQKTKKV